MRLGRTFRVPVLIEFIRKTVLYFLLSASFEQIVFDVDKSVQNIDAFDW